MDPDLNPDRVLNFLDYENQDPDPGSGMGQVRVRIRDEQPGSYFLELGNHFFVLNMVLKFFDADPG